MQESKRENNYPPIADYALISDCHCAALVSRSGSIDWCCMPRMDADSCFGRLLDWGKGGYCAIVPVDDRYTVTRRYLPGTMVLETLFQTDCGTVKLTDFFTMDANAREHTRYDCVRLVEGVAGSVELRAEIRPRFDFGEIVPLMRCLGDGYAAIGGNKGLVIHADIPLQMQEHYDLEARFRVETGEHRRFVIHFEPPERIDAALVQQLQAGLDADGGLARTVGWWQDWSCHIHAPHAIDAQSVRSAVVLKSLTFESTGAIAAAPTTSLPEWIGETRNWDYRFSWVRDSVFTVRALYELGCEREAERFLQFIQRSSAGSASQLQIMYGVDGKRRLTEMQLDWLEGYSQSRPVRIGNFAAKQSQLDIYGEILEMAWEWHASGHTIDDQYWHFLVDVVNTACDKWQQPDYGIWEFRGGPRHYVHSKGMCWSALNYGIRLAEECRYTAPTAHWRQTRDAIRDAVEGKGYDAARGIFVQAFDSRHLDAALLLLPRIGFIAYDDARMMRTTDAICEQLDRGGLLVRYNAPDGLPGHEGAFLPCTFWLVSCLAYQGRHELAWKYYRRAAACANDIGLFSEEFDTVSGQMLGNFPQGLTHVSQIMARLALAKSSRSEPIDVN